MTAQARQTPGTPIAYIVDDDPVMRQNFSRLLEADGLYARSFASAKDFLEAYRDTGPCCLVLDLVMPGMDGLELLRQMKERGIQLTTVLVSGSVNVPQAVEAMRLGTFDLVQKPFRPEPLVDLVRRALDHDASQRQQRARRGQVLRRAALLTQRERTVLDMVVDGRANKQIALALGLSEKTVEIHRSRVMRKMGADSLAELVRMAFSIRA